jgi:hypothetical protein
VIVDQNHTLRLSTLSAKLAGVTTSKTVTGATATSAATGEFVTAALTITNKLHAPQSFDHAQTQQAGLILAGAVFKEAVAAESQSGADACRKHDATAIEPGKSMTCDVIFDVPAGAAADVGRPGSGDLYLVNFGSDLAGRVVPQTIGQIRLYH